MEKSCNKCLETKPKSDFHKDKYKKGGIANTCKSCACEMARASYHKNKDKAKETHRRWREKNREKRLEYCRNWHRKNREQSLAVSRKWKKENPDAVREYERTHKKQRLKNDPLFKLARNCRIRIHSVLGKKSSAKTGSRMWKLLGCTGEELAKHLESQFVDGMSLDNYGQWHIDHITPLASANTEDEIKALCHYTNLQPLWAIDNIKKGAKVANGTHKAREVAKGASI